MHTISYPLYLICMCFISFLFFFCFLSCFIIISLCTHSIARNQLLYGSITSKAPYSHTYCTHEVIKLIFQRSVFGSDFKFFFFFVLFVLYSFYLVFFFASSKTNLFFFFFEINYFLFPRIKFKCFANKSCFFLVILRFFGKKFKCTIRN